jgi:molybdate transport system substrate-binding protein
MRRSCWLAGLLLTALAAAGHAAERVLTVFAAASLTDALQEVGRAYTAASGVQVRFSFAASSTLARQIEAGAPAQVFFSADQEWMDYLATRGLIQAASRADIVTNSLVLVAPADSKLAVSIGPGFALAAALGRDGRLAMGDPETVPVGRYGKAALTRLGVWDSVSARVIAADNVRTALNFVARGEAPLGIVYATDARSSTRVRVVDTFPAGSHEPITYPAAATSQSGGEGVAFVRFLQGGEAVAIFSKYGFATAEKQR